MLNDLGIRRTLIYLDTCFIRELSRAGTGKDNKFRLVRSLLTECVNRGIVACPSSRLHDIESEPLTDQKRRFFRDTYSLLSRGIAFLHHEEILRKQIMRPLYRHLGREGRLGEHDWREAFERNPDADSEPFCGIRVEFPLPRSIVDRRKREATEYSIRVNQSNAADGRSFNEIYEEELETLRQVLFGGRLCPGLWKDICWTLALLNPDMSHTESRAFFENLDMSSIPYVDVMARIYAGMRKYHPSRQARPSDLNDAHMLAMAVPYCDIVATDKFWVDLDARPETRLGERYGTILVSAKKEGVDRLFYLLLSLLLVPPHRVTSPVQRA